MGCSVGGGVHARKGRAKNRSAKRRAWRESIVEDPIVVHEGAKNRRQRHVKPKASPTMRVSVLCASQADRTRLVKHVSVLGVRAIRLGLKRFSPNDQPSSQANCRRTNMGAA